MKRNTHSFLRQMIDNDGHPATVVCYDGTLTVQSRHGRKTAAIGSMPVQTLANILLRELVEDRDGDFPSL